MRSHLGGDGLDPLPAGGVVRAQVRDSGLGHDPDGVHVRLGGCVGAREFGGGRGRSFEHDCGALVL